MENIKHKHKEGVQLFVNKELELEVRAVEIDGEGWLVGKDITEALGYSNSSDALKTHVDDEDKCKRDEIVIRDTIGRNQKPVLINESGLYSLILRSDMPKAKQFKRWVTSEILPSIRKHGMYATDELLDNPDLLIAAATKLKEERKARLEAEKKVENLTLINAQQNQRIGELQPKASYYDLILQNNSLLAISSIAKDYGMSGTSLNKKLHELGVQYKLGEQWLLYAKYHDKGYTFSKTQNYSRTDGRQGSKLHTYWTQKGRLFIYDLLKQNDILPLIEREESEVI